MALHNLDDQSENFLQLLNILGRLTSLYDWVGCDWDLVKGGKNLVLFALQCTVSELSVEIYRSIVLNREES